MPNHLGESTSPYLLQHAANPVDWFPWGEEAFDEAQRRDVPVMASVGYSSCHWCHVMALESFSDPEVAEVINANVVAVKVDREERPDVDAVYMSVTTALTGQAFFDWLGRNEQTHRVLMREAGFLPMAAGQARTRDEGRRGHTKHMLRFRHADARPTTERRVGQTFPEIVLLVITVVFAVGAINSIGEVLFSNIALFAAPVLRAASAECASSASLQHAGFSQ